MGDLAKKTTITAEGLANLIEQLQGKTNLPAFASTFLDQLQDIENASFELIDERTIDTSVGVQLDGLGQIIGISRDGRDDNDYRTRLRAQILVNLSSGTTEDILGVIALIVGTGVTLRLEDEPPAGFTLHAEDAPLASGDGVVVAGVLSDTKAAGVRGLFHFFETAPVFKLDGADSSKFDGGSFFSGTIG